MPTVRTTEQERERKRAYRERKRLADAEQINGVRQLHSVPSQAPSAEPPAATEIPAAGEFETLVRTELDELGELATKTMAGQAGNAIAMARILDNPAAIMQHAGASGQLRAALLALHEAAKTGARSSGKVRMLRQRHVAG